MDILPFNILYSGINLAELFPEINSLTNKYLQYFSIIKTDSKEINYPAYAYDVDSDTFGMKDAFGNVIESINGYFVNTTLIEVDITFPVKKADFEKLYNNPITIVRKNDNFKWLPIFDKSINYNVFNKIFYKRYEYFLNILYNGLFCDIKGKIKAIDSSTITITDSDNNDHKINRINGKLNISINDSVSIGYLLEKTVSVNINNGIWEIVREKEMNSDLIKISSPINNLIAIK